ncbi:MAG: hypothetical protein EZS28_023436 [Streblomastix strix]|uniref:Uncharacterized protein n=1 Tax=Streblomastix strix TaxID=222440 RepID=A0A5J4VF84_9EUKA|nr:MAG: hypothetical protein EZS28_023436 [Streblomastix strix]
MSTIQTNQIRVHKSKHVSVAKKELSEEDKTRLQAIDSTITNVPRETAQVEPEEVVKDTYLSHPNLEVQKFIIDVVRRTVDSRKKGEDFIFNSDNYFKLWSLITQEEENDVEVVMEEPLMRYNSCTSKKYKKKEIVRINDVLIKNVSIKVMDNVLYNSIENLYRVNVDFVRLSDKIESEIDEKDF